jgi:MFS family permease
MAITQAPRWGWVSAATVSCLVVCGLSGAAWIAVELRSLHPLIDMRMMRTRIVWTTNVVAFLFGGAMYSSMAFLPQLLQAPRSAGYGFGASVTKSGVFLLPQAVGLVLLGFLAGQFARRLGLRTALFAGCAITVLPFLMLSVMHEKAWQIYVASALLGIGPGIGFAAMSNIIVQGVPARQTGVAAGMNANIRTIGGALGTAVAATLITARPSSTGLPTDAGYVRGFIAMTAVAGLAAVASLVIPDVSARMRDCPADGVDVRIAIATVAPTASPPG